MHPLVNTDLKAHVVPDERSPRTAAFPSCVVRAPRLLAAMALKSLGALSYAGGVVEGPPLWTLFQFLCCRAHPDDPLE